VFLWGAIRVPHEIRNKRKNVIAVSKVDVRERLLLIGSLSGLGLIPGAYCISALIRGQGRGLFAGLDWTYSPAFAVLGAVIFAGALVLFFATHRQLKRNWSQTLELRADHTLVTHGVYRLVRHPMYTAFFLWAVAQVLLLQNTIAGLCGLVGFGMLYTFRVGREEAMMREAFGQQWDEYVARTRRLIPYVH
jgi:protein-S-isoprenylcysteine O-methyltransferase Ste14